MHTAETCPAWQWQCVSTESSTQKTSYHLTVESWTDNWALMAVITLNPQMHIIAVLVSGNIWVLQASYKHTRHTLFWGLYWQHFGYQFVY